MIEALLGIVIGLIIGLPVGFLLKKQKIDLEIHRQAFDYGFEFGKDSFFNPQAKG